MESTFYYSILYNTFARNVFGSDAPLMFGVSTAHIKWTYERRNATGGLDRGRDSIRTPVWHPLSA